MTEKKFRLAADQIESLIEPMGGCIATDRITVDGQPVGYMYREPPSNPDDSGWRFFAGDESDDYVNDADNLEVYDVNTIANYDREVIPLLDSPIGSAFAREGDEGELIAVESPFEADELLHPDFPILEPGVFALTDRWSLDLPLRFNKRLEEDGQMVLWRPGVTIYASVWGIPEDYDSSFELLRDLTRDRDPDAFDYQELKEGKLLRIAYRLVEDHDGVDVHALYCFVADADGYVHLSIYFDAPEDVDLAKSIWQGIASSAP
ncbi:DUF2185 domain-containing protein [Blastopirellula sp. JC732]|uniref:DUF2185 domain-containing protein n=1 Tax=Blastopirellula sediminis TaxID=2894196 RepID=A0A9X1MPP8_9BACT|nr:DUF2185 domain-containing protein [Blastopirellula sediminis]MCC9605572.1 DUF2185 domain-containing protein [Blastopirellula sediminis]MCC9631128.1 DUF2185 domain-containing protein [Blastopirellula sediminis]